MIRTALRTGTAPTPAVHRSILARLGILLTLGLVVMAAGAGTAHAQAKRLGVVTFRGPAEGATRNVVTRVSKSKQYKVIGGQAIAKTASKLRVRLDDNDGFKAVARELGITAFVVGEVTKKKATLTVRNGSDGSVSAEASWVGANPRKLSQSVGKSFWKRLGPAIARSTAPSGAKQAVVAEEAEAPETGADDAGGSDEPAGGGRKSVAAADDSSSSSSERSRSKPGKKNSGDDEPGSETTVSERAEPSDEGGGMGSEALIISVGPRVLSRSLSYTDDRYRRNSKYNLGAAPEFGLNVDLYPAALAGVGGFASNIGLTVDLSYLLPVVSSPAPNNTGKYTTYGLSWSAGVKVRLPAGLFGTVALGDQRFQLTPTGGAQGIDVPMVDYRFIRIGAGGRFAISDELSLMANLSYLHCLGLGGIATSTYYPKATCAAIEGGAGVGYRINNMFEIQAGAAIRRFGLAFHQNPANYPDVVTNPAVRVAGGAIDQFLTGYVALAVVLGGGEGGGSKAEPASEESDSAKKSDDDDESKPKKEEKEAEDEEEEEEK